MPRIDVQYAQNLNVGDKIRLGKSSFSGKTVNGEEDIVWRVISKDHNALDPTYPANTLTLIADTVTSFRMFDGKETANANSERSSSGNNRWRVSNLRQWLNSDKAHGQWFVPQNLPLSYNSMTDAPPSLANTNVQQGNYPYDVDAGFLFHWQAWERALLKPVNAKTKVDKIDRTNDGVAFEFTSDLVTLPSRTEMGLGDGNYSNGYGDLYVVPEGVPFPYFTDNASKTAGTTQLAWNNSRYNFVVSTPATGKFPFWLRSIWTDSGFASTLAGVSATGAIQSSAAYAGTFGVRPIINIDNQAIATLEPDANGVHTLLPNIPPVVDIVSNEGLKVDYTVKDFNGQVAQVKIFFNGQEKETITANFDEVKTYVIPYGLTVNGINELRFETLDDQFLKGTQVFNVYIENNPKVPVLSEKLIVDNQIYTVEGVIDNDDGTVGLQLNDNLQRTMPKGQVFEKVKDEVVPLCSVTISLTPGEYMPMELKSVSYEDDRKVAVEEWELFAEGTYSHFKVNLKRDTSATGQYVSKVSQVYSFKDELQ